MNIGFVGLGKLGLPCALAIDAVDEHSVTFKEALYFLYKLKRSH